MKNTTRLATWAILATFLSLQACTLEKEQAIPAETTNLKAPVIFPAQRILEQNGSFKVRAKLSSRGNLKILQHGWVWSEHPNSSLQDNKVELGTLSIDSFETEIKGLSPGKTYYLRPYLVTGSGPYYGLENCATLNWVHFEINTDSVVFQGATIAFNNTTAGTNTYRWNFGDGNTSLDQSPVHTFQQLGTIRVQLTASNGSCQTTKELVLNVSPNPFKDYWASIPGGTFLMGNNLICFFYQKDIVVP